MVKRLKNYIGGQFVEADATEYMPVVGTGDLRSAGRSAGLVARRRRPRRSRPPKRGSPNGAARRYSAARSTCSASRACSKTGSRTSRKIVVQENGKTRDEARGEVRRGIESVEFRTGVPSAHARLQGRRHRPRHRRNRRGASRLASLSPPWRRFRISPTWCRSGSCRRRWFAAIPTSSSRRRRRRSAWTS